MFILRSRTKDFVSTLAVFSTLVVPVTFSVADGYSSSVVMSGLDNPRGLALGPDGSVYVAEAGRGGTIPGFQGGDGSSFQLGTSGGVSVWSEGMQQRLISGLPSAAVGNGGNAIGLHDLDFETDGSLVGLFGLDTTVARRSRLGTAAHGLGTLARLDLGGSDQFEIISDLASFEQATNPDRRGTASNPYGLVANHDGSFLATDAAGNSLLQIGGDGVVTRSLVLPSINNPLPMGPPLMEPVPTGVARAKNGDIFVSELTGFPFARGSAHIYRHEVENQRLDVVHSGFTNLIDLAVGEDNSLYALELSSNGLAAPNGPGEGVLWRIEPATGERSIVVSEGLSFPTSVLAAPGGVVYLSNFGTSAGKGEVLRLAPRVVRGDFNSDFMLTSEDIDLLTFAIRNSSVDTIFDLNQDGKLNNSDRETWVTQLAGTFFGDTNLDKSVAFIDFLTLSQNYSQHGGWAAGDFTGDDRVSFPDFLLLSSNFGRTTPVAVVPEPLGIASAWLVLVCGATLGRRRIRRHRCRRHLVRRATDWVHLGDGIVPVATPI